MQIKTFDRQLKNAIIIFGAGISYWLSLVFYREYNKRDVIILRKNIIFKCNGWCVSHFVHYLLLGYFSPKYYRQIIVTGIVFEIIEIPLNRLSKYIDSKLVEDSVTNTMGILTGLLLSKIIPNKIDLYKSIFL